MFAGAAVLGTVTMTLTGILVGRLPLEAGVEASLSGGAAGLGSVAMALG
jgi:hypothetical protein